MSGGLTHPIHPPAQLCNSQLWPLTLLLFSCPSFITGKAHIFNKYPSHLLLSFVRRPQNVFLAIFRLILLIRNHHLIINTSGLYNVWHRDQSSPLYLCLINARVDDPEQEQQDQQDHVGHEQILGLIHCDGCCRFLFSRTPLRRTIICNEIDWNSADNSQGQHWVGAVGPRSRRTSEWRRGLASGQELNSCRGHTLIRTLLTTAVYYML